MGVEEADLLQKLITDQQTVTSSHEQMVQKTVNLWAAIRESNRPLLQMEVQWPADRPYIVDPLGERIPEAYADFLFGEDPVFTAGDGSGTLSPEKEKPLDSGTEDTEDEAENPKPRRSPAELNGQDPAGKGLNEANPDLPVRDGKGSVDDDKGKGTDQDRLEDLVEANALPSELHEAAKLCVSEGEVWYRIYRDDQQSDYPIIEWHSRSHVRPLFRGRKLIAIAFVSDIYTETVNDNLITYKYVDIQTENYNRNLLFKGENNQLGQAIRLKKRPETSNLKDEWTHDLGMLSGRIVNRYAKDRRVGVSDYQGVRDLILSLNEATTIGHENARLTLKKRLALPREALNANGKFDAGEDVLIMDDPLDEDMGGGGGQGKFAVLEYSFDADALIAWKNDLANIVITRVGLVRQFIDTNGTSEGNAVSGTALRTKLIPTTMAGNGKGRAWDDELPDILVKTQMLDSLPEGQGGFGRSWSKPGEPPSIERGDPLPVDETEKTNRHVAAVGSEIESRYTAIKDMHPDWDDAKIDEEIKRIQQELKDFTSASTPQMAEDPFGEEVVPGEDGGSPNPNAKGLPWEQDEAGSGQAPPATVPSGFGA